MLNYSFIKSVKDSNWYYVKCDESKATLVFLKDFGDEFYYEQINQIQFNDNVVYSSEVYTSRHDPRLIKAIEELGEEADGLWAELRIAEIDSDLYRIDEHDGLETVITPEDINWIKIK